MFSRGRARSSAFSKGRASICELSDGSRRDQVSKRGFIPVKFERDTIRTGLASLLATFCARSTRNMSPLD
jgi:hypothetical protein